MGIRIDDQLRAPCSAVSADGVVPRRPMSDPDQGLTGTWLSTDHLNPASEVPMPLCPPC